MSLLLDELDDHLRQTSFRDGFGLSEKHLVYATVANNSFAQHSLQAGHSSKHMGPKRCRIRQPFAYARACWSF